MSQVRDNFVGMVRSHIGRAIYCWGGQGQEVESEAQIRRMETSASNAQRAIDFWYILRARGVDPVWMDDCSGLNVWPLMKLGLLDHDITADGFSNLCPTISKADLRIGDLVFNLDDNGNAFHMGTVTRMVLGVPYITEAYGRDRGVIERSIASGYWDDWSHNPFIDTSEEDDMIYCKYGDGKETPTSSNPAVRSMQDGLVKLGIKMISDKEYPPDGRYGTATVNGVQEFKTKYGLPGDGKSFDSACLTVMLAQIAAIPAGITQAQVDAAVAAAVKPLDAKIAALIDSNVKNTAILANVAANERMMDQIKAMFP